MTAVKSIKSKRTTVLFNQLNDGLIQLMNSKKWAEFLEFQSKFHCYSFNNVVLIFKQLPNATKVASFTTWKKLNRTVMENEKAIWILAPIVTKVKMENDGDEIQVRGFKYVPVFDISQTTGEEPPSVCNLLGGNSSADMYETLIKVANDFGFKVTDHDFSDTTNGDCSFETMTIRIKSVNSINQRIKTLAHELAHGLLHEFEVDRAKAELEAESVAYIVCAMMEIDTSDYTFGYLGNWGTVSGDVLSSIKESGDKIQKCAESIYKSLESNCESKN